MLFRVRFLLTNCCSILIAFWDKYYMLLKYFNLNNLVFPMMFKASRGESFQ